MKAIDQWLYRTIEIVNGKNWPPKYCSYECLWVMSSKTKNDKLDITVRHIRNFTVVFVVCYPNFFSNVFIKSTNADIAANGVGL